jgi:hypothetical protein
METPKLRRLVDKLKLTNILKIGVLLIVLALLARAFIPSAAAVDSKQISKAVKLNKLLTINPNPNPNPTLGIIDVNDMRITSGIEGFTNMSYAYYGNQLTLQDPINKPIYRGNTCTFNFDGMYRIEAFKIIFNNNPNANTSASVRPFKNNATLPVYVQYQDGNGNMRYIQSSVSTSSIPNFNNTTNLVSSTTAPQLSKDSLVDENNLAIYTSSIVITVGDSSNAIDSYRDSCDMGYISNWGFWGSTRDMLSKTNFEQLAPSLATQTFSPNDKNTNNFNPATSTDTYIFSYSNDYLTYGLALSYNTVLSSSSAGATATPTSNPACRNSTLNTNGPFKVMISYDNGLYPGNNFKLNNSYIIRNDPLVLPNPSSTTYVQFPQPFIAKNITITVQRATVMDSSGRTMRLNISGLGSYGVLPSNDDITNYQKNVNLALSASNRAGQNQDVCPSMDDLVAKQNQTQAVCDNLEYQDKIKAEKIRLEKNKQYLLKLQQQQQQIDQLNTVIQTLDGKRQARSTANDQARVLQYQQQRGTASTIRDLANQRLQSQAANQLYMDVNINTV